MQITEASNILETGLPLLFVSQCVLLPIYLHNRKCSMTHSWRKGTCGMAHIGIPRCIAECLTIHQSCPNQLRAVITVESTLRSPVACRLNFRASPHSLSTCIGILECHEPVHYQVSVSAAALRCREHCKDIQTWLCLMLLKKTGPHRGMLSPFFTSSSNFLEMVPLSRPSTETASSTPKSYRARSLASALLLSLTSIGNLGLAFFNS